ncbi:MAG: purine-nucleoside phosphorylase, partial [Calditrichaeota bacterium]
MRDLKAKIEEAGAFLREKTKIQPEVGIILGTGLGALAEEIDQETAISYDQIPHFPISTVESHAGRLIFGKIG